MGWMGGESTRILCKVSKVGLAHLLEPVDDVLRLGHRLVVREEDLLIAWRHGAEEVAEVQRLRQQRLVSIDMHLRS